MHKQLCILVCFFSKKLQSVATRFLGLVPIPEATGEMIFMPLKKKLRNVVKLQSIVWDFHQMVQIL